jgi:glycosyltransferase involved in cell wall biosynthesis
MNMDNKPEIIFTFPDCLGGVANFNRNIINNAILKSNYYTKVILLKSKEDKRKVYTEKIQADEVCQFIYSSFENQYYVCKRLNKLLNINPGYIVTDNNLTLNTLTLFKSYKTIFFLVHDYFYINYALQYEPIIDVAIAHSSFFKDILCAAKAKKYMQKAFYIPYGVEQSINIEKIDSNKINLVFLGRWVEQKGILELYKIEKLLSTANVKTQWTIIGTGPCETKLKNQWLENNNAVFVNPTTTKDVYDILSKQDALVLPTSFEGTPVSILEAISNGVIPVVSDLPGGIRDIVTNEIGYRCTLNEPESFAKAIRYLFENKNIMIVQKKNCIKLAREKYDIIQAANNYFSFFMKYPLSDDKKQFPQVRFSRLDNKFLPNRLVEKIRRIKIN